MPSSSKPFPLPRSARIAVFASGRGSNLASLIDAFPPRSRRSAGEGDLARVMLVVSNVPDAPALERAAQAGVACHVTPWTRDTGSRDAFEREVQNVLDDHGIDLVCLAGFMRILSPTFTHRWQGRMLNIHPSLLPKYPGLHAQRQALAAGDTVSGCSVHFVDAGVDTGTVVVQRRVPVRDGDDETRLAARILEQEHLAYPEAIRRVVQDPTVGTKEGSS